MKGFGEQYQSNPKDNKGNKIYKEQKINQAIQFHLKGNIREAANYYQKCIDRGFKDHRVFSNYGTILNNLGKLKDAELLYRKAIEINPNYHNAHYNLGKLLCDLGKLKDAELSTRKAIDIYPDFAKAHSNLGRILSDLGNLKDAEMSYRRAIEINPNYFNAHSNLGRILSDLGNSKDAEMSYRKAIELNPNYPEAYYNLGKLLYDLDNLKDAEISYHKAIELNPNYPEAYYNLGKLLCDLGKLKEAELSYRRAIQIKPDFAIAHSNLGNVLSDLGNYKEAELSYRRAIQIEPNFVIAYSNLGNLLSDLGRLKDAESSTRKAIELNPNYPNAHFNLGNLLINLGKLKEAELSYRKAIELKPSFADAFLNLSFIELLKGNYQSGLENYEFRFKTKKPSMIHGQTKLKRIDHKKLIKGEKILVISEQGLGDTLQYMRYIPYLKNQGLDIIFSAQEKLHSLIKASGIDQNPLSPEETFSVLEGQWIPLLSLPRYLQIRPDNPIITQPYIFSTDQLNKKWTKIFSKEKKPIIGINWQGNKDAEINFLKDRSFVLEIFSILARNNNFKFLSLQKGFGSEQLEHCSFKNKFVKFQTQVDNTWDFLENAAIIWNCDLVITSCTSIAHLAGGMGKKVWLLLKDIPYWTWGLKGESTFWYPSMRLFRQNERNNWQEVMERVSKTIQKEMEGKV